MSFRVREDGRLMGSLSPAEQKAHYWHEFKKLIFGRKIDLQKEQRLNDYFEYLSWHLKEQTDRDLLKEIIDLRCGRKDLSSRAEAFIFNGKLIQKHASKVQTSLGDMFNYLTADLRTGKLYCMVSYLEMLCELEIGGYREFGCPTKGECVYDIGAFTGESTITFASCVGDNGEVHAFEFADPQFEMCKKFVCTPLINRHLSRNIQFHKFALGRNDGVTYGKVGFGADARPNLTEDNARYQKNERPSKQRVYSLDYILSTLPGMRRPDFIKMDVEGCEFDILQGAKELITKHKPRLAVCIYHNVRDFDRIPRLLKEYRDDYVFRLGHYSPKGETETVLYAL